MCNVKGGRSSVKREGGWATSQEGGWMGNQVSREGWMGNEVSRERKREGGWATKFCVKEVGWAPIAP